WYEAGWGPMISETAFFIKDVFGPRGSVSIVAKEASETGKSDSVESHTKTEAIRCHCSTLDNDNRFVKEDTWINVREEPVDQEICTREPRYFYKTIKEDIDLSAQIGEAVNRLGIAFAGEKSILTGKTVYL